MRNFKRILQQIQTGLYKTVSTIEKIKRTVFIALGFALATYLIMSGIAILENDSKSLKQNNEVKIIK